MLRQYYISDNLNELEELEQELLQQGLKASQFHVLSEADAEVEHRHLHAIEPVLKKDVVRATEVGAALGLLGAIVILLVTYAMQWHVSAAGWMPFVFSALVLLGFCTWQGGLIGIQVPHHQFRRFEKLLSAGKHVFFVDIDKHQQQVMKTISSKHPGLIFAGTGKAAPAWVVKGRESFHHLMKVMP